MTRKLSGDRCRCNACGEYFRTTSAFDKHRTGPYVDRRCLARAEMTDAGMAEAVQGDGCLYWTTGEWQARGKARLRLRRQTEGLSPEGGRAERSSGVSQSSGDHAAGM